MNSGLVVITVTLNDSAGLFRTIESLYPVSHLIRGHFIIDGGSVENNKIIIDSYKNKSDHLIHYISEKDGGIFDAMNKGINVAKLFLDISDDYLLFLNSGDEFNCSNLSEFEISLTQNSDLIFYIACVIKSKKSYLRPKIRGSKFYRNETPVHQATVFKGSVFSSILYNLDFSNQADTELIYKLIMGGYSISYQDFVICNFYYGGSSSTYANKGKCLKILSEQIFIMINYNNRGFKFIVSQTVIMYLKFILTKFLGNYLFSKLHYFIIKNR